MEYQALNESAQMMANDKRRSIYINKVESGVPRWLIEIGFVFFVIQAINTSYDIAAGREASVLHRNGPYRYSPKWAWGCCRQPIL